MRADNVLVKTLWSELAAIEFAKDAARRSGKVHEVWLQPEEGSDTEPELIYWVYPTGSVNTVV
ncbi:MAG TPA: hypothetical protein VGJ84_03435 [Polyangiaceae bacterium]